MFDHSTRYPNYKNADIRFWIRIRPTSPENPHFCGFLDSDSVDVQIQMPVRIFWTSLDYCCLLPEKSFYNGNSTRANLLITKRSHANFKK